jgi:alkylation response protein AidB-like acyl-CoA dehydrogenase
MTSTATVSSLPAFAPPLSGAAIRANVDRALPTLAERADAVEAGGRLTGQAVDLLRSTGVFRMAMPAAWGGPEVGLLEQVEILEALARADASAGWCAMIGSDSGYYAALLNEADARELYVGLDSVTAGWVQPAGALEVVDGGYRLSGRWSFGSGCTHADVIAAGALVTENGVPVPGPDGLPQHRIALLPAAEAILHEDTWQTTGLRGSGSLDYSVDGLFVPAGRTFAFGEPRRTETLYRWPGLFIANLVAVPLGTAGAAIDHALELLAGKTVMPEMILACDEPRVRSAIARTQAAVGAARAYVTATYGAFWATLEAGDPPSLAQRAQMAGCWVHTLTTCRTAVDELCEAVGTSAIRAGSPLERRHRDLITMGHHLMGQPKMAEWAGGLWFGRPAPLPVI